jgi:hypothetical protein
MNVQELDAALKKILVCGEMYGLTLSERRQLIIISNYLPEINVIVNMGEQYKQNLMTYPEYDEAINKLAGFLCNAQPKEQDMEIIDEIWDYGLTHSHGLEDLTEYIFQNPSASLMDLKEFVDLHSLDDAEDD